MFDKALIFTWYWSLKFQCMTGSSRIFFFCRNLHLSMWITKKKNHFGNVNKFSAKWLEKKNSEQNVCGTALKLLTLGILTLTLLLSWCFMFDSFSFSPQAKSNSRNALMFCWLKKKTHSTRRHLSALLCKEERKPKYPLGFPYSNYCKERTFCFLTFFFAF